MSFMNFALPDIYTIFPNGAERLGYYDLLEILIAYFLKKYQQNIRTACYFYYVRKPLIGDSF